MPSKNESHLDRKLRQLGLSPDKSSSTTRQRYHFKLYFPQAPHDGVEYRAAKTKDGYNFVGLVLGHGGTTLQTIQRQTGTKIEIHDSTGNLNGAHPAPNDMSLHALVLGDCKEKLEKGVRMITEVLEPVNTSFATFPIEVNGSAHLSPAGASRERTPSLQQPSAAPAAAPAAAAAARPAAAAVPPAAPKQNPWSGRQRTIPAAYGTLPAAIPTPLVPASAPPSANLQQQQQQQQQQLVQNEGTQEQSFHHMNVSLEEQPFSSNESTDSSNASEHWSGSDLLGHNNSSISGFKAASLDPWPSSALWGQQQPQGAGNYSAFSSNAGANGTPAAGAGTNSSPFPGGDLLFGGFGGWSPMVAPVLKSCAQETAAPGIGAFVYPQQQETAAAAAFRPGESYTSNSSESNVDHLMELLLQPQQ